MAAHAPAASDSVRGSKFEYGFSGGSMKRLRFAAMLAAACAGLIGLSACGGGSNQISIVLATANGLTMMDETLPPPSTPSTLNIMASVGGDTTGKGVTWLFQTNQSGCGGAGTQLRCKLTDRSRNRTRLSRSPFVHGAVHYEYDRAVGDHRGDIGCRSICHENHHNIDCFATRFRHHRMQSIRCAALHSGEREQRGALYRDVRFHRRRFTLHLHAARLTAALPETAVFDNSHDGSDHRHALQYRHGHLHFYDPGTRQRGRHRSQSAVRHYRCCTAGSVSRARSAASGTVDGTYNGLISSTGGVAPLTFTITSGTLPPGLSLNATTGQISGVPINNSGGNVNFYPHNYPFAVQVQDSALPTPQKAPASPAAFSITIQGVQPLQISPTGLPTEILAQGQTASSPAYSATLNATGRSALHTWTVIQGQLPSGLTICRQSQRQRRRFPERRCWWAPRHSPFRSRIRN